MRKNPSTRPSADSIYHHPVICRARLRMEDAVAELFRMGETRPESLFKASPLASADDAFLADVLGTEAAMTMDCNP
jgi:mitosis inhibitor protein kinase SWE1